MSLDGGTMKKAMIMILMGMTIGCGNQSSISDPVICPMNLNMFFQVFVVNGQAVDVVTDTINIQRNVPVSIKLSSSPSGSPALDCVATTRTLFTMPDGSKVYNTCASAIFTSPGLFTVTSGYTPEAYAADSCHNLLGQKQLKINVQ